MPSSTIRVNSAALLLALPLAAWTQDGPPDPKLAHVSISTVRRTITIGSDASQKEFDAAVSDLYKRDNWRVEYLQQTVEIEPPVILPNRSIQLKYRPGAIPALPPSELPAGSVHIRYVPLGTDLVASTGAEKPASASSPLDGCLKFVGTDDKEEADIDITGGVQAPEDAKPQYFWRVKAGCSILGEPRKWPGQLSFTFTSEASQEPNADPDAMKAGIAWLKRISPKNTRRAWILMGNPLSYEFERKINPEHVIQEGEVVKRDTIEKNSNLMWSGMARLVTGWRPTNVTLGLIGFEAGRSLSRTVKADSRDSSNQPIARLHFNADAYRHLFACGKRILVFHGHHTVRLPFKPEPYTRASENDGKMYLTNKPRHWTLIELLFPFTDGFGVNVQYKRGSEPPSFEFVNHQVTIGFNLLLKGS